jgi:hypothetical protein
MSRKPSISFCALVSLAIVMVAGCASKLKVEPPQSMESSPRLREVLGSDLAIERLPISAHILVDEKTRNYSVSQRPSSRFGGLRKLHLPIGPQLMEGIRIGSHLAFKEAYEDNHPPGLANLEIALTDFFLDYKFVPPGRLQYTMRMTVESQLKKKDGAVVYGKALPVHNEDLSSVEDIGCFGEKMGHYTGDAVATLVALWVRTFVKDITQDSEVRQFAQSVAGPPMKAEIQGPEIAILSLKDSNSTDQGAVQLIGSIRSKSPIQEIITSLNGRTLQQARGIAVTPVRPGEIRLNRRIPLSMGENVISITAMNEAGGTSQKVIRVTRHEPALAAGAHIRPGSRIGERWAVVVSISDYLNTRKGIPNLSSAADDALAFAEFLRSPQGGGFKNENVLVLTGTQATSAALRHALFTFLKKAIEEDFVIFFFSGQGAPEPGILENYYLLTYDADPDDLPSTAIPTWDVDIAFRRNIKAKRAVILADASHVSSIGTAAGTRGVTGSNLINRYLKNLSETGEGKVIFTSTQEGQISATTHLRGRNTGLFTHYLLEALSGAADENRDGVVTLGEAIDYTTDLVSAASRGKQRPDIAGKFDRDLPLAVIK